MTQICENGNFPTCCSHSWTSACVGYVFEVCGLADCSAPACDHSMCTTGAALPASCDVCTSDACSAHPSCCNTSWTNTCINYTIDDPNCPILCP